MFPGVVAVAEPTSMTWLGLHVALQRAGCDLSLVGTRHSARLRGAISGKLKSDVIDADVLSLASDVFALSPLDPPLPAELALRRAVVRRGKLVIDGNRARRRLISLARWAFPDVWTAFAGSWPTAIAVLTRWPDLRALAAARRSSVTAVVAAHTRGVPGVAERAGAVVVERRPAEDFGRRQQFLAGPGEGVGGHRERLQAAGGRRFGRVRGRREQGGDRKGEQVLTGHRKGLGQERVIK